MTKYRQHLTKRPGKCTQFEYELKLEGNMAHSANLRPFTFVLRNQAREQIQVMLKNVVFWKSRTPRVLTPSLS